MKNALLWLTATVAAIFVFATTLFVATTQGWFLEKIATEGDSAEFVTNIKSAIDEGYQGNAAMVMIENGEIIAEHYVSKGVPVHSESVFGVASVGKWVAAVAVVKLAEQGKLDLDAPVSNYLTRWQLPPSEFDNNGVTARRLLSHTAGITDGLGHDGFPPGTPVQPLVEHLTLAADREPDKSGRVAVGVQPGTQWQYSGGSYNLLQLLVEEVTGEDFAQHMQKAIFKPLGMHNTGYVVDRDSQQTAQYFGENQTLLVYPNYTSLAATGLYSTASDLAKFVRSQIPAKALANPGNRVLSKQSILEMHQPLGSSSGIDIWGAGVILFADNNADSFVLGHGGRSPRLNATARLNPANGNAFIMIQTGNEEAFASDMATRWTNWEAGTPDIYQMSHLIEQMITRIAVGSGVIVILGVIGFVYTKRRKASQRK